ncbi:hypothetical protein BGW38_004347, partial [Lunasporangiospora selenospora]
MSLQVDFRRDTESTPTHFLDESGVFTSLAFGLDALDGGYRFLSNGAPRVENDPLDPTLKTPFEAIVSPSAERISLVSPAMVDFSLWSDRVFDDVYMHDPPSYSPIISPAPSSFSASSTPSRRQSSSDSVPPDVLQLQALPLISSDDSFPHQGPSGSDTFESSSPSDLERTILVLDSPSAYTTVLSPEDNTVTLQDRTDDESQGGYATRAKPSAQQKHSSNNRHSDTKDEQGKDNAEDPSSSSSSKEKDRSDKKTKGSSGTAKTRGRNTRASSRSVVTGSTARSTAAGSKPTSAPSTLAVTKSSHKKTKAAAAKRSHSKNSKGAAKTGSKKSSKSSKTPKNTQTNYVTDDAIPAYDSEEDDEDSEMDDIDMDPETMTLTEASSRKHLLADESESEAKRQKFLERNRQAAHRCREKKRLQTLKTIADADLITTRNQELHENLDALQEEVRMLKNQILCHRDCGCDVVQQFVKSTFGFAANSSFPKPAAAVNYGEGGGGGGGGVA